MKVSDFYKNNFSEEMYKKFLMEIPKAELHVHLDGSLRLSTLIGLAQEQRLELPSYTEEGMRALVFKPSYQSLDEYLQTFTWAIRVLQNREALEQAAYELALDNIAEGVRYLEVRFAPQLHTYPGFPLQEVIAAVDRGLSQARESINQGLEPEEPPFEYGIILCALRAFSAATAPYYRELHEAHPVAAPRELFSLASVELAREAIRLRRETGLRIAGFDLAGKEIGCPAGDYEEAIRQVAEAGIPKTVHAGEADGPESIFQALTRLDANRIGHGLHFFDHSEEYSEKLIHAMTQKGAALEVCLTSNLQTVPELKMDIRRHSLGKMLAHKLPLSLCADNRLVSNTSLCREYQLALDNFPISPEALKEMVIGGFKHSFYYDTLTKGAYIEKVRAYYEGVEKKYEVL